jgi:hypothetical protein
MRPTRLATGASVVATVPVPLAGLWPLLLGGSRAFVGYTTVEALELVVRGRPLAGSPRVIERAGTPSEGASDGVSGGSRLP